MFERHFENEALVKTLNDVQAGIYTPIAPKQVN